MAALSMSEKQKQMTRLIRSYIKQLDQALTSDNWLDIQRLSKEVKRLAEVIHQAEHYKKSAHAEIMALQMMIEKVHRAGMAREQMLSNQLAAFRSNKEGLKAYQEVLGWE